MSVKIGKFEVRVEGQGILGRFPQLSRMTLLSKPFRLNSLLSPLLLAVVTFSAHLSSSSASELEAREPEAREPEVSSISSFDLKETPVGTALKILAEKAKVKLLIDKPVGETPISLHLSSVTPKQALEILLRQANLRYEYVSEDIIVVTDAPPVVPLRPAVELTRTLPTTLDRSKNVLSGSVVHRESLAPISPGLRVGATFDATSLKALTPNNFWHKVPSWSTGSWHTETNTTFRTQRYKVDSWSRYLSSLDLDRAESPDKWQFKTFTARGDERRGFQKDRSGQIWEYEYANYLTKTELDNYYAIDFISEKELLESSSSKLVMRYVSTGLLVSKRTHRIGAASQQESIQTYTPAGGNMLRCLYSLKSFDEDGQPESLTDGLAVALRTAPFHPWNVYEGRNMRKLFEEYLISHGMADLVPNVESTRKSQSQNYKKK